MSRTVIDLANAGEHLEGIDPRVEVPTYDRSSLRSGIVHFGIGGFHRAHLAAYLDRLRALGEASDWAITGVGVLPHDRRVVETLRAQGGRYTLVVKHPDGRLEPRANSVFGFRQEPVFAPQL